MAGHVIAIYLAHIVALRLLHNPKLAMRSQYPMVALMMLYTVFSLWIFSQPSVEIRNNEATVTEEVSEPAPTDTAPQPDPTLREPPMPTPP